MSVFAPPWLTSLALASACLAVSASAASAASTPLVPPAGARPVPGEESLPFAPFGTVHVYAPAATPDQVVLFVSGDGGWNLGVVPMARRLQAEGALVVGIDVRSLLAGLERAGSCAYPAGSLEELSRTVQLRHHLPEYRAPILVGYSSGATLVYVALAQAPAETFRGAISLGFCSDIQLRAPLCPGRGLASRPLARGVGRDLEPFGRLDVPWTVLQGEIDQVCAPAATARFVSQVGGARLVSLPAVGHGFSVTSRWEPQYVDAYRSLAAARRVADRPPAAAAGGDDDLAGLGVVAVPADGPSTGAMAVLLSGDGGWAGIDKALAGRLAAGGVPVVGWNSLKYYWTPRTPDVAARDLARILEHYQRAWGPRRVLLAGYSFGADVLPFLVARLPVPLRERVEQVALLGLSPDASFAFHVTDWVAAGRGGYPTAPEVLRLAPTPVLCLQGEGDADSGCRALRSPHVRVVSLPGGHHFAGDYARIADALLAALEERRRATGR
jgi:type IV secretory pathway VirJ component